MRASIDISLYPLANDYVPSVQAFIERLELRASEFEACFVVRGDLSTQVFGEFTDLMQMLTEEVPRNWDRWGKGVFVLKMLRDDLRGLGRDNAGPIG